MRALPFVAAATVAAAITVAGDLQLVEGIVVRVNDTILTVADMRKRVNERAAETGAPVPAETYATLVEEAADDLCLLERAAELKVEVADEEIAEQLQRLRQQNRIESDEHFEQTLRGMGLSVDQLRARIREQVLIDRVMQREIGNVPVTEEELRQRYAREQTRFRVPEQVHLEHLVFAVGTEQGDAERTLARAQQLVAAVRSGREFAAVLKEEIASDAATGGDLGTVAVPDLRPEVRDAVATLKAGELADPFRTPAGVHVVRLVERKPEGFQPFDAVTAELRQQELAERFRARMRSVVDDLKKRYVVEMHPELLRPIG